MSYFGELISTLFERRYRRAQPDEVDGRTTPELCEALLSSLGEVSGAALARKLLDRYAGMSMQEKATFFEFMMHQLEIDPESVTTALQAYKKDPSKETYRAFANACEPKRQELARRLNQVPGATARLVAMRKDLLGMLKERPDLEPLDVDFKHLFSSWFNRGFLVLRPISWESPAHILEKIIAYEAVHAIDSWDDLRRRLEPSDRRCFAFFHPSMPDEPLIFVEVALTVGIPSSVQNVLAEGRVAMSCEDADTAVFYSISNCQSGLASISFGNSLIKQVASDLSAELEGLSTFVTLSPIPNLTKWLDELGLTYSAENGENMRAAAAYYLLNAKAKNGLPFDPVARFHLGNGAIVHDVHADADISEKGQRQSGGAMVNYLYDLRQVEQNNENFVTTHEVPATQLVKELAGRMALTTNKQGRTDAKSAV